MPTIPTPLTANPDFPSIADRATYNAKAYAWAQAMKTTFTPQLVALASNVHNNALEADADALATFDLKNQAAQSAANAANQVTLASNQVTLATAEKTAAALSAQTSAQSAALPGWVTGTNYAAGQRAISLINGRAYMSLTAGISATDPATDTARWQLITSNRPIVTVTGTSITAATGNHYVMTNAALSTLTLPASPTTGMQVEMTFANNRKDNLVARNGSGLLVNDLGAPILEDLVFDAPSVRITLEYAGNAWRFLVDAAIVAEFPTSALNAATALTQAGIATTQATIAQASAGVAAGAARLYIDDAAGLAATAEGGYYSIPSGSADEVAIIKQKVSGAAVDTGKRTPSASAIVGTTITQGVYPATDGTGSTTPSNLTIFSNTPISAPGNLAGISVYTQGSSNGALVLASVNGDGTLKLEESRSVTLASGVNTFTDWNPRVSPGWLVGVYSATGFIRFSSATGGLFSCTGIPGLSTVKTASSVVARLGWLVQTGLLFRSSSIEARAKANDASIQLQLTGATLPQGETVASLGNVLVSGYTAISLIPMAQAGALSSFSVYVGQASVARLLLLTQNPDKSVDLIKSRQINVSAGLNIFTDWNPHVETNYYLGVYVETGGVSYDTAGGSGASYCLGVPGVNTPTTLLGGAARFAISCITVSGGARTSLLESVSAAAAGNILLSGANSVGVLDSTSAFAVAYNSHPQPYVPPGTYAVTALPAKGEGFYGAGKIFVSGVRSAIPAKPQDAGLLLTARARHVRPIADGSALILLADSIGAHFNASSMPKHWFSMYERWVNSQVAPGGEIASVVVRDDAAGGTGETALFYGLTVSGGSNGTRGPVGRSVILAVGGYIEFTGNYAFVDAFYQQQASAGSLAFSFNGAAAYKTLSASGVTQLDKTSGPSATGQAVSGVYRITATGTAVEITGIVRQAAAVATAGTPNRLNCMRMSYGGTQAADVTDARVDAILAQANGIGGGASSEVYIGLGTNDMLFGASTAAYESNMQRIITRLLAGGVTKIRALSPIRMNYSQWSTQLVNGNKFDQYLAALVKVCAANNIPLLRFDVIDFLGRGLLSSDGLHPNDAGFDLMFDMIARWDAA